MKYNARGFVTITADDAILTLVALQYDAFVKQETKNGEYGRTLVAPYGPADLGGDVMDTLLRYAGIDLPQRYLSDGGLYTYNIYFTEWHTATDATLEFLAKSGCGVKGAVYGEEEDAWKFVTELGDGELKEEPVWLDGILPR